MKNTNTPADFVAHLRKLRNQREKAKNSQKKRGVNRRALKSSERELVFSKTDGRCHICGGILGERWHADHVLAHSAGGKHSADNYLPAHPTCNNYRSDYLPEEFELILKIGVWARTQIEKETVVGRYCAEEYFKYDRARRKRNIAR